MSIYQQLKPVISISVMPFSSIGRGKQMSAHSSLNIAYSWLYHLLLHIFSSFRYILLNVVFYSYVFILFLYFHHRDRKRLYFKRGDSLTNHKVFSIKSYILSFNKLQIFVSSINHFRSDCFNIYKCISILIKTCFNVFTTL